MPDPSHNHPTAALWYRPLRGKRRPGRWRISQTGPEARLQEAVEEAVEEDLNFGGEMVVLPTGVHPDSSGQVRGPHFEHGGEA